MNYESFFKKMFPNENINDFVNKDTQELTLLGSFCVVAFGVSLLYILNQLRKEDK